jgi:hypothetical protein
MGKRWGYGGWRDAADGLDLMASLFGAGAVDPANGP